MDDSLKNPNEADVMQEILIDSKYLNSVIFFTFFSHCFPLKKEIKQRISAEKFSNQDILLYIAVTLEEIAFRGKTSLLCHEQFYSLDIVDKASFIN